MRQSQFIASLFFSLLLLVHGPQVFAVQQNEMPGSQLDELFQRLKSATSEAGGRSIEADIWKHWSMTGGGGADKLMKQAKLLASRGYYEPSLGLLERVIYENPTFVDGWNRKATVLFFMRRDAQSLTAIARVLALEPRHFGALAGKAMIYMRVENWSGALQALRRAVEVHPWLKERHLIKLLEKKLNVRDL